MKKDLDSIILTNQELKIMNVIWDKGEVKARDVLNVISHTKKAAYTTISTELTKLEKKGVLVRSKKGITNFYKPLLSHQQAMNNHIKYLIDNLFSGNPEKLLEFVMRNMLELTDLVSILYSKGQRHSMMNVN
ncbi:MAG: BlaI/MecI/CopY family transcriptional regulator [Acidobacteria bacterium]|nr:BlaI/MecI/CopY family transcriptional regulator [Acidobacteriota bacterium]